MGKELYFLFTASDRMPFSGLGEHEPLIIAFSSCCLFQELGETLDNQRE